MEQSRHDIETEVEANIRSLEPLLKRSKSDKRPVALMMCGVSGAGKSTYSKAVAQKLPSFQRVSIDGIVAARHGIYGVDYPSSAYEDYLDEAAKVFEELVGQTLADGKRDVILDRSFYAKEDRDFFKKFVEERGGRWVLLNLQVPRDVLWKRVCERRECGIDADSAREISKDLLDTFFDGFEIPNGEGEIVVQSSS